MANRSAENKFCYLKIEFISSGVSEMGNGSNIYTRGYYENYMKCTIKEFEALKIKLMLNKITEEHKLRDYTGVDRKTRSDRLYRDILYIMQNCKILHIYKFDIHKNILKDDIQKEIKNFLYENKDKCITEFGVYI